MSPMREVSFEEFAESVTIGDLRADTEKGSVACDRIETVMSASDTPDRHPVPNILLISLVENVHTRLLAEELHTVGCYYDIEEDDSGDQDDEE